MAYLDGNHTWTDTNKYVMTYTGTGISYDTDCFWKDKDKVFDGDLSTYAYQQLKYIYGGTVADETIQFTIVPENRLVWLFRMKFRTWEDAGTNERYCAKKVVLSAFEWNDHQSILSGVKWSKQLFYQENTRKEKSPRRTR